MSIILGIDPGLATVGFGLIESINSRAYFIDCGVIKTSPQLDVPERLSIIRNDFLSLFNEYKPDAIGIEELFFARNVTNALKVAHARGVILECAHTKKIQMFHFTPLQVKNNITGDGNADKWQVQEMVKRLLNLNTYPKPDDAADALAIALCAAREYRPCEKAEL